MDNLMEYLPFLIPIIILEVILIITSLVHLLKHRKFRIGNIYIWIPIVIFIQIIGPILYFTIGRGDD